MTQSLMAHGPMPPRPSLGLRPATAAAAAGLLVLLAGCASKAPPQRLLALPIPALPTAPAEGAGATRGSVSERPVLLQLGRLDIPEYWQSRAVRYRQGGQDIAAWPDVRWAERVEVAMSRHLAVELAGRLPPNWQLCTDACRAEGAVSVRLLVTLPVLDYARDRKALAAWARWSFQGLPDDPRPATFSRALQASSPSDGPQGQAQAMAALIRDLATHIAGQLPALPAAATGAAPARSPGRR